MNFSSSNISAIYKKLCAQTFSPIFVVFAIFDRIFAKTVAPPSNENENYVAPLKEQSLLKKNDENRVENCNIGVQLQSLRCIVAQKLLWKTYFLYDFWCAQTCSIRGVFGLPIRSLTIAVSALTSCGKIIYTGAHLRSRP